MTLVDAQQRASEIAQRLQQLSGPRPATTPMAFAAALQRAVAAAPTGPGAAPAATTGALAAPAAGKPFRGSGPSGADVVALAKTQLGTPYVWGGEKPGGFDCSGLIQWAYGKFSIDLPRVSRDQAKVGRAVSPAEARPGDLVFFDRPTIDHIGMYAGNGQWVVAPKTGDVVKMQNVDLSKATTIRRVLPDPAPGTAALAAPAGGPVAGWAAGLPARGRPYAAAIEQAGRAAGVDPRLLAAVAWSESGFDPSAKSPAGALGLMQIMPRTAAGLGVDPMDPAQALRGGATYLSQQLRSFGTPQLALAAYNAGPGAVRKHGGIPPYDETRTYVATVLGRYRQLGGAA